MDTDEMLREIRRMKEEKDAVILAHNYQIPEIQDIADFVGDSLDLARKARNVENSIIVFCGVTFMAETAKILNPDKKVLIPEISDCPMAAMVDPRGLEEFKKEHPGAPVVAYINTTAEVKAMSDICVTSANAARIVNALDEDEVIFIPDKNLGQWVARNTSKKVHIYPGYCFTHNNLITKEKILVLKKEHPDAEVIVHPECRPEVIDLADGVESTNGMLRYVRESSAKEFIVGTEYGMTYRLQKEFPSRRFYGIENAICSAMKEITVESLYNSLKYERYEISLPENIMRDALKPIERMLELS